MSLVPEPPYSYLLTSTLARAAMLKAPTMGFGRDHPVRTRPYQSYRVFTATALYQVYLGQAMVATKLHRRERALRPWWNHPANGTPTTNPTDSPPCVSPFQRGYPITLFSGKHDIPLSAT